MPIPDKITKQTCIPSHDKHEYERLNRYVSYDTRFHTLMKGNQQTANVALKQLKKVYDQKDTQLIEYMQTLEKQAQSLDIVAQVRKGKFG